MAEHRISIDISAPPDRVFALWMDLGRMTEWARRAERLDPDIATTTPPGPASSRQHRRRGPSSNRTSDSPFRIKLPNLVWTECGRSTARISVELFIGPNQTVYRVPATSIGPVTSVTRVTPPCGHGMACCRTCLRHRDLTPRPGTPQADRQSRTVVPRPSFLEVVQDMLRAVGRPHREEAVIVVPEAAAATQGDEPGIPDLGEDHPSAHSRSFFPIPFPDCRMIAIRGQAGQATRASAAVLATLYHLTMHQRLI